ncbi:STAS domain-containing protein [Prauserella cavernicola]|uniref:STAS domain-containing protein n=1 Tax=Prauserella cavernicola TaxID=2800127 RepID=A0A934QRB6_9PSEU|nr:STAS domain-containing protein [Prauserella cavernicola]MBK1785271.1 STAS domain-containing protein [Prauserella cavernicola]
MTVANIEVLTRDPETIEIAITGEIDLSNADVVRDDIFAAIGNHLVTVRLNLAGVTYLDSAGLRILFSLAERLRLLQADCQILAPEGSTSRRVVELAGLDTLARILP